MIMTNNMIMMIKRKIIITVAVLLASAAIFCVGGCEESLKTSTEEAKPIFFPPPPDPPRMQFLKFYSGPDEIGEKHVASGFESFIMGDEDSKDMNTPIKKPYGFAIYEKKTSN